MTTAAETTSPVGHAAPVESRPSPWWAAHRPAPAAYAPIRSVLPPHDDLTHLEFLPFGIHALHLLYEARPVAADAAADWGTPPVPRARRRALAFGAVVGCTFLTGLYYLVFLLVACA